MLSHNKGSLPTTYEDTDLYTESIEELSECIDSYSEQNDIIGDAQETPIEV